MDGSLVPVAAPLLAPTTMVEVASKKEVLQTLIIMLKEILQPGVLRNAAYTAAVAMGVEKSFVDAVLATPAATAALAPPAGAAAEPGKPGRKKKDKALKADGSEKIKRAGKINAYTLFVTVFLDYIAHYGRNPKVVELKREHPTHGKVQLAATIYTKMADDKKKEMQDIYRDFLEAYNNEHMSHPGGNKGNEGKLLEELAKFEARLPPGSKTLLKLLELKKKSDYATEPAEMKAEAAAAKEAAKAAAATAATPMLAPAPGVPTLMAAPVAADDSDDDEDDTSSPDDSSDEEEDSSDDSDAKPPPAKPVVALPVLPVSDKKRKADTADAVKKGKETPKPEPAYEHEEKKRQKKKEKLNH